MCSDPHYSKFITVSRLMVPVLNWLNRCLLYVMSSVQATMILICICRILDSDCASHMWRPSRRTLSLKVEYISLVHRFVQSHCRSAFVQSYWNSANQKVFSLALLYGGMSRYEDGCYLSCPGIGSCNFFNCRRITPVLTAI